MLIINPYRYAAVLASASDNFDSYADLSDLNGQGNWVSEVGSFVIKKPASDGSVRCDASSTDSIARKSTPLFAPNQMVEITLERPGIGTGSLGVTARCQSGAGTCYGILWDDSSNSLVLFYMNAGVWNQIAVVTRNYVTGAKIRISVTGSSTATRLSVDQNTTGSWVNVWTNQDPGFYLDSGQPGIYGYGNEGSGGLHGDDWSATDL